MENRLLFVCGSFCTGMVHFKKIENFIKSAQPAKTIGTIFRLPIGYPAFTSKGQHIVFGQVFEITGSDLLVGLLDEFHGYSPVKPDKSLYFRESIEVLIDSGEKLSDVITYVINPKKLPKSAVLLEDGDWKRSLREYPALTDTLSDKQISYVKKLGSSSGRDIVPIDLDLYRELMKMELIVDKGRRLALTRLGKDVYRYLT